MTGASVPPASGHAWAVVARRPPVPPVSVFGPCKTFTQPLDRVVWPVMMMCMVSTTTTQETAMRLRIFVRGSARRSTPVTAPVTIELKSDRQRARRAAAMGRNTAR